MAKDAYVLQTDELRVFAKSSSRFGEEIMNDCHRGINSSEDALRSADYYRNLVRRKVEEAEAALKSAEKRLSDYESQDHIDKDGNNTYDHAYVSQLKAAIQEARHRLSQAKEDQEQVMQRYLKVRKEVESMVSELSSSLLSASNAAGNAYRQISAAASILEQEYTNK